MKPISAAFLTAILLSSCAPSTPQARIDRNPQVFASLEKKEQQLVQQGQLSRGMSADAVKLAWGEPAERFEGSKNSRRTERWDYTGSRPIYTTNVFGGYGYGYGYSPYGPGRYSTVGFGVGPEIAYVPYRVASVWFVSNKVDSWERAR